MDKCLLVGNGLNRTLKNSISWSNLLQDISKLLDTDYYEEIPLPLEFERIINTYLSRAPHPSPEIYSYIKSLVIKKIKDTKLPDNAIHKRLLGIKLNAILTTNYDYLLEYAFDNSYMHRGDTSKKYLFDPTSVQKSVAFYHLHGMASSAPSICLGYEHYIGIVEKLRNEFNSKQNNQNDKMKIKQILYNEIERKNTWGERFYTSDIDILGFDLGNSEVDIWWLITHRAYLFYSDYCGLKSKIKNTITFYDIINDIELHDRNNDIIRHNKVLAQKQKHLLLINNHIEVKTYLLSQFGDYLSAYNRIIEDIKGKNNGTVQM